MALEPDTFPTEGRIAVIATSGTAATTNLADAAQLGTLCQSGRAFWIQADADVYAKLAYSSTTEVSGTATSGAGRGFLLEAKKVYSFYFAQRTISGTPGLNTFLSLQAVSGTPNVRVAAVGRQHA